MCQKRSSQSSPAEPVLKAKREQQWRCTSFRSRESPGEIAYALHPCVRNRLSEMRSRNFDSAVFRRHQLSVRISYHEADQIAPRLDVKTCLQSDSRTQLVQRFVFPPHSDVLLRSLNKDAVLIEERGNHRQFIGVSAIY